jgi:transcriptional regulator with XRE-family HTH domain
LAGAVHTDAYRFLRQELVGLRIAAGMSQAKLAEVLGKPASFVAKYELGERRLDAIELCVILRIVSADPKLFFVELFEASPDKL